MIGEKVEENGDEHQRVQYGHRDEKVKVGTAPVAANQPEEGAHQNLRRHNRSFSID